MLWVQMLKSSSGQKIWRLEHSSRNDSKLFYELKLVTDNILSMQQPTEKPLKNI